MNLKNILKIEELVQFALCAYGFSFYHQWWWFWVLLLLPDLSMLGYLFGPKLGAFFYNLFHHKALALAIGLYAYVTGPDAILMGTALILYGHSSMDRLFGYGLKYTTAFKDTHLGTIGA